MISMPRCRPAAALIASIISLESCNDGLLHAPAPPGPARVTIVASMSRAAGGAPEAFDRATSVFVRFRVGDDVRVERDVPFAPAGGGTTVAVDVPLRQLTETVNADVELRAADRPLFRGTAAPTLSAGSSTPIDLTLEPVVASVLCGNGVVNLTAYGQTAQLFGAALFATGDTIRDVPVTWSVPATTVVNVGDAGDVTALQDGDATVTCGAGGFTGNRSVHVFAEVGSVQVAPPSATLIVGASLPHTAALFDTRGNVITTPRPLAWSSASTAIATVSATGVVTGVAAGTVRIYAKSGAIADSSTLTVVAPSTAVTIAATNVTGVSARLLGSVNPRGSATQGWFEWGTDPLLANASTTSPQTMGGGTGDLNITDALNGLTPGTTYYFRTIASSAGGKVQGSILTFSTPRPPSVTTDGADPTATTGYLARGTVTANGNATTAWFEYGTSSNLATVTRTATQSVGSGSTPVALRQVIGGFQAFTLYYVRTAASSVGGTTFGPIISFRTAGPPSITAANGFLPPGTCQQVQAGGGANPNGAATQAWFEYGSTSGLGSTSAAQSLGAGTGAVTFGALLFGTPIYWRAVASNAWGTVRSQILSLFPSGCIG
jgi:hypothetical protein